MPRRKKKDEAAELAGRMVQVLEAQRRLGSDSYSLTLRRLAELTDPAAPPELVRQAIAKRKEFAARVVAAHARDLDAPVALGQRAAEEGRLTTFVGGPREVVERTAPVLRADAREVVHIGEAVGSGQVAKMANNLILWAGVVAVHESLVLAERLGVSPSRL